MYKGKTRGLRLLSALLMLVLVITPIAQASAADSAVKKSNYIIKDMSTANSALESIAASSPIKALVYLKDVYTIREEADAYSTNVATVATGTAVNITGVDEDSGRNIWYKVSCTESGTTYTGYIEREFLAYSDERLLSWEEKYVTTVDREAVSETTNTADIEQFPESYKSALYALKKAHPDWTFVRQDCNLDWSASVAAESQGDRSLIDTNGTPACRMDGYYGAGWAYASDGSIAYYMDPRNFLTETQIFQFELLTYNASYHTEAAVQKILAGTFMSGNIEGTSTSYSSYFMTLASQYNISPILQAARVISEQGTNGSAMISGTYPGYEGLYNYYNIQAYGSTTAAIMQTGLEYAKSKGWTSRQASLAGGAAFLSNGYVSVGQDTLYLQKWDLIGTPYTHQYMQAVYAAYSNAKTTYNGYSKTGVLNTSPFVFRIPVYNNMPSGKQINPGTTDQFTINMTSVENLPVDQSAVLIPYINGAVNTGYTYTYTSSNTSVATVDSNGVITGVKPGTATISCKAGSLGTLTCTVKVIKADIAVSDIDLPEISVTYSPDQKLSDISLPSGFSWVDGDTVPTVTNEGYTVTYAPDNSKYNSITLTLAVDVAKATIDASSLDIPTDLEIEAGSELTGVALPKYYTWEDTTIVLPSKVGTYKYMASYCPDPDNYEVTTGIEIPVKTVCTSHKFGDWSEPKNGVMYRTCSVCGETEELKVAEQVKEPDCTTNGHTMVDGICTVCGYEEPVIQVHTHSYTESDNTATCEKDGVITYTCSCGDSYTEEAKATGHKYKNGVCTVCGAKYSATPQVTPVPQTLTPSPTVIVTNKVTPTTAVTGKVTATSAVATPTASAAKTTTTAALTAAVTPTKVVAQVTSIVTPTPAITNKVTNAVAVTKATTATAAVTKGTTPTVATTKAATPTVATTKAVTPTTAVTKAVTTRAVAQVTSIVTPTAAVTNKVTNAVIATPTAKVAATATPTATAKVTVTTAAKVTTVASANTVSTATPTAAPTESEASEQAEEAAVTPAATTAVAGATAAVVQPAQSDNSNKLQTANDNKLQSVNEDKTAANKLTADTEAAENITEAVTESATEVETIAAEAVKNDKTVTMKLEGTTELKGSDITEDLSDAGTLSVEVGDTGVTWNIDLSTVENIDDLDLDLSVTFDESEIPNNVVEELETDDYILMTLGYDGAFGFDVALDVPVGTEHTGKYANLYYYNPETGEMELVDSVLITEEGLAQFNMKHASEYAITFSEEQLKVAAGISAMTIVLIVILALVALGGLGGIIFVGYRKKTADSYLDEEDDDTFRVKKKEDIEYFN